MSKKDWYYYPDLGVGPVAPRSWREFREICQGFLVGAVLIGLAIWVGVH